MHDYDNNSKLDGLEIFQGLSHHEHTQEEGKHSERALISDKFIIILIFRTMPEKFSKDVRG